MSEVEPSHATHANDALVEVHGLRFAYGKRRVLEDINMTIGRGRVVAILGPSGCGKSTLLKLITAQLTPDAGEVRVAGEVVHQLSSAKLYELRRRIGMMFQQGGLFTDLDVFENIAFPMRELTDLPDSVVRDLVLMKLNAVGLRGASRLLPRELSGGMARRVALARAIALDPMLVLYDEPFAGLDPISLNVIANLIRTLNDALGSTSVVVTYDVSESLKVADDVYFISDGRVVAGGPTSEMLASKDPFVCQFVQAKPDGPVAFHYPARDYEIDLGLSEQGR